MSQDASVSSPMLSLAALIRREEINGSASPWEPSPSKLSASTFAKAMKRDKSLIRTMAAALTGDRSWPEDFYPESDVSGSEARRVAIRNAFSAVSVLTVVSAPTWEKMSPDLVSLLPELFIHLKAYYTLSVEEASQFPWLGTLKIVQVFNKDLSEALEKMETLLEECGHRTDKEAGDATSFDVEQAVKIMTDYTKSYAAWWNFHNGFDKNGRYPHAKGDEETGDTK